MASAAKNAGVKSCVESFILEEAVRTELASVFADSALLLTEPCMSCEVDWDAKTFKQKVDPKKPYQYACIGVLHKSTGLVDGEIYVVKTNELTSTKAKQVTFDFGKDRVSFTLYQGFKKQPLVCLYLPFHWVKKVTKVKVEKKNKKKTIIPIRMNLRFRMYFKSG
jgi:hypothetical protein